MAYATVDDYGVITGSVVPEAESARLTLLLQSASDLFALYLGDREVEIAATYGSLLRDMVVSRVSRMQSVPTGIRSESAGGSSVTYDNPPSPFGLTGDEVRLLSMMLANGRVAPLRSAIIGWGSTTTTPVDEQ